jgi:hypothetical protein
MVLDELQFSAARMGLPPVGLAVSDHTSLT